MLLLVRHGQTAANAEGRLVGRLDPPLNDLGRRQAQAAGQAVRRASPSIARVISSPLARTRESAAVLGLAVEIDDRWIELDYGDFDGRLLRDLPADMWAAWKADPAFVPAGGESLLSVGARVRSACLELSDLAAVADVVVFSHVSPIKAAISWAMGIGDDTGWRMHLDTASICRIGVAPAGPILRGFNDTAHLGGLGSGPKGPTMSGEMASRSD